MPERYSDEEAKLILARAIEIDLRADTTTADDLRSIASDVGISRASLEAAMRERAAVQSRPAVTGRPSTTVVAALGLPLGLAAGSFLAMGTSYFGLAALGLTGIGLIASGALVVLHGATATHRSFQLRNLALWGGVVAGSLVSIVLFDEMASPLPVLITVSWAIRSWIASSILGSAAVIAVRKATRANISGSDHDLTEQSQLVDRWWVRASKRVLDLLSRTFRREQQQILSATR